MKVLFRRLRDTKDEIVYGMYDKGVISIDLSKNANPAHTFTHELLHHKHPDWSETKVKAETTLIWKRLTLKQRLAIYRKLFSSLKRR